ncbi:hypothetical protein QBC46DRAFT_263886 [Diplogelasinospora grovesii]|uniref:Uncharacterized protein n=1 Tax=Diplogelasinospora grovesii TaxID=303347 RepID=A0AAN6N4P4_9PEZI|nr:hypothetical protein QBC46DRAFT_263886 [Diplogelasinospora grovesii]
MDSMYSDQSLEETYSQNPRSRAGSSGVSTTEGLFQTLQLVDSPANVSSFDGASYTGSRPPSSRGLPSPAYISASLPHSASFVSASPYPLRLSQQVLDAEWFETQQPQTLGTPLLRVEAAPDQQLHTPPAPSSPPLAPSETGTMSAVAVHYDAGFNMGSRSSYSTWPGEQQQQPRSTIGPHGYSQQRLVLESSSGLLGPDLSHHHYGSDASMTPPSGSRSVTASPPRGALTPEQRELKRQRDQARRDTKMQVRTRRTGSGSSSVYSPPVSLADLSTGASSLPIYTTAPSQISLLAEPPTTQYLPPFSPPLTDQSHYQSGGGSYTSSYPPPSSYMTDYSSYPPTTSAPPSLPSHYGYDSGRSSWPTSSSSSSSSVLSSNLIPRRSIMADPNSLGMYPVPSVMGGGPGGPQDAAGQVRVVTQRPKPQCWEHGCNGRQFSTFSNLLRHQREKSGQAAKATCPNCGAEFTRTTARNGHLLHDKCKQKRNSQ